jgi:hypothetical protein
VSFTFRLELLDRTDSDLVIQDPLISTCLCLGKPRQGTVWARACLLCSFVQVLDTPREHVYQASPVLYVLDYVQPCVHLPG